MYGTHAYAGISKDFCAYENYFINFHTLLIRFSHIRNSVTGPLVHYTRVYRNISNYLQQYGKMYTKTVCTSVGSTNVGGYITTLKNKQKLDVSSEGQGPSLETSSFSTAF
jgi:hypothetical protein